METEQSIAILVNGMIIRERKEGTKAKLCQPAGGFLLAVKQLNQPSACSLSSSFPPPILVIHYHLGAQHRMGTP